MTDQNYRRKLTAILSMDVIGYSRLMMDDDAMTVQTITAYREVIGELVDNWHGRIVDSPGDNILTEFRSVVDAVQCALNIQQELKVRNAQLPESRRMEFRMGINLGDVIEEGGRLYGDGVNIAARLETLAEEGGICISDTVFDQIKNKLKIPTKYAGEHEVKNIADPIKVYCVMMDSDDMEKIPTRYISAIKRLRKWFIAIPIILILGIGSFLIWKSNLAEIFPGLIEPRKTDISESADKPSIAVLPFDNMSGDPEQEYFSDGLTEDIITDLSKVSGLFVIARNSSFVYKDKPVSIKEVGQDLGVAYVLEGSVRKANGEIRITAQLIDASTGGHLWAERYDRDLEDIFAVQDEVVERIVSALAVTLTEDEQALLQEIQTNNLEAYDYAQRGWWYYHQFTKETNDQAKLMFEQAIELDSVYADAYAGLGFTYYETWAQFWSQDLQVLDRAYQLANEAIALNDSHPGAYTLLSHVYLWRNQHDLALVEQERALSLEPNNSFYLRDMGEILIFSGRPEEAIDLIEKAMLLDPHYPVTFPFTLGFAHALVGFSSGSLDNYEQSIEALKEALNLNPNYFASHILLAFVYSETGEQEQACDHIMQAVAINPQLSSGTLVDRLPFKDPTTPEILMDVIQSACPE